MRRRIHILSLRLFVLSVILGIAANASAQQQTIERQMTQEQFKAAGLDKLSPEELANLNAWLDGRHDQEAATRAPEAVPPDRQRSYIGLDDKPIRSRVKGAVSGWEPGTLFELENGQQWRVLKGSMKLRKPLHSPEIVVVPGVAGRWFLQVDEDLPKARVYRVD